MRENESRDICYSYNAKNKMKRRPWGFSSEYLQGFFIVRSEVKADAKKTKDTMFLSWMSCVDG